MSSFYVHLSFFSTGNRVKWQDVFNSSVQVIMQPYCVVDVVLLFCCVFVFAVLLICCVVVVVVVVVVVRRHVALGLNHEERQCIKDTSWSTRRPTRQSPVMCDAVCLTLWRLSDSVRLEALFYLGTSFAFFEYSQAAPTCPSDKSSVKMNWVWSTSGMILAGEECGTVTKTCPIATLLRHQSNMHRAEIQPGPP